MPFLSAITELRVLICDADALAAKRLAEGLQAHPALVDSVRVVSTLEAAHRALGAVEINTVFVDPLTIGIEETSRFVFEARQRMPWIVFVLYVEPSKIQSLADFYSGPRERWHHYFMLSKERSPVESASELFHTLHLCLSDIRLMDSATRTKLQMEFVASGPPIEIQDSLKLYRQRFPQPQKTAFVMMQFDSSNAHARILRAVKDILDRFGVIALRADDSVCHHDLFYNVLTHVYGCDFGIAIFERITSETFNPNVSLEVGYMMALKKPICLLKDRTLRTLPTDLVGRLYTPFDPLSAGKSIASVMRRWIVDRAFPFSKTGLGISNADTKPRTGGGSRSRVARSTKPRFNA